MSYDPRRLVCSVVQGPVAVVDDDVVLQQLVDANYSFGSVRVVASYSVIVVVVVVAVVVG